MNTLLLYMIKAAFYLSAFYLVYSVFLSRDTMYGRNRAFILFSLTASFILPLATIRTNQPLNMFFGKTLSEVFIQGAESSSANAGSAIWSPELTRLLLLIYISGLALFILRLLVDLLELMLLVTRNRNRNRDSRTRIIKFNGLNTTGFSALGYIFINSSLTEEDKKEVQLHEQNHLDKYHFVDIIYIEIIRALQWFNPFIHLFNRSLRAVHEFQADEGCLRTGIPVIIYQRLIMCQLFRSRAFMTTNSFSNPTLIKKRMIMMTKERSRMPANLKLLMVLPVIAVVMLAFSSCKGKTNAAERTDKEIVPPPPPPPPPPAADEGSTAQPYEAADIMPVFPGGDAALMKFISENTKYPENAKTEGLQGRVIVRFAVETDGSVDKVSVLKGVDPELDTEAVRVIETLPNFEKPAYKDGKPVPVWYMVPITYKLN